MIGTQCLDTPAIGATSVEVAKVCPAYPVRAKAKEPLSRDVRREKPESKGADGNRHSVTVHRLAETGLAQRSSRLCGLAESA
jgi:hypothetical protein